MKLLIYCSGCKGQLQTSEAYVTSLGDLEVFVVSCFNLDCHCHTCTGCEDLENWENEKEELKNDLNDAIVKITYLQQTLEKLQKTKG